MIGSVLLVDDDRALRKLLRAYLEEEAIAVVEAGSGEEALASVERVRPDVVLLDVRLPGIDGFEVLRRLSTLESGLAVMLVTSLEDDVDQLVAYRLGAVDFVTKPVSPKILSAKVKAFLARLSSRTTPQARTVCGPLAIEHDARRALVDGRELPLTRRELELLIALAAHPGWVYPRDHLLLEVWGIDGDAVETRLVDQHVANLRRKLADAGADGIVQTVRGLGYRLAPPAS
ncbi:MAG: response regulator transcription factor [Actinobacteria bacterium]|nr:response regulator transcription factor [Actinomycetota bacterium]